MYYALKMFNFWNFIKNNFKYIKDYILSFFVVFCTIFILLLVAFLIVGIFNIRQAFNTLWDFYYDGTLRACYCDKVDFKYTMSFFKFKILFPFITFEKLGKHYLQTVRRMYWYVILFYSIPVYAFFFF